MKIGITGQDSETYWYYKLAVVDGNDNRYNETEPKRFRFPPTVWALAQEGRPFNKTALETRRLANALISLYKYIAVEGDVSAYTELYDALVTKMATLESGSPVEGDEDSGFWIMYSLANAFQGLDPIEPKETGDPIQASEFNAMHDAVLDALRTIQD